MDYLFASTTLSIVFVVIFILQIVLIFLITWFPDWLGRVSGVELHALVPSLGYRKSCWLILFGSGRGAVISLVACHVQKFIGAFAFGIDSETL